MAHLVKLEDYISRYETDIQQYPSHFIRLKRERWNQLQRLWVEANRSVGAAFPVEEDWFAEENKNVFKLALQKASGRYKRKVAASDANPVTDDKHHYLIGKSRESLHAFFYYELLQSQLKWASSSLSQESSLDSKYRYDSRLRELLRVLPDNYMVFYYPIFKIEQADIQLDVLLLSPSHLYCVTYVETPANTLFEVGSHRFWCEFRSKKELKRLNPILAVNRMEGVIRSIFKNNGIDFPIKKVVLLPDAIVDNPDMISHVKMIDHRHYAQWIDKASKHASPMKKLQFQAAESLLKQGKTKAHMRTDSFEEFEGNSE